MSGECVWLVHDMALAVGVKLAIIPPLPEKLKEVEGKDVFLVAATLRPETMCGQTNLFVLPTGQYGVYEINGKEIFIISAHAARSAWFIVLCCYVTQYLLF